MSYARPKPAFLLPLEVAGEGPITVRGYQTAAARTDRMDRDDLATPILGLFGEIGSLLAALKKKRREGEAYATYDATILEELGDVLWYLSTVASHAHIDMELIAQHVPHADLHAWDSAKGGNGVTFSEVQAGAMKSAASSVADSMTELAGRAGELVEALRTGKLAANRDAISGQIVGILRPLVATADAAGVTLDDAARGNLEKTFSRWPLPEVQYPKPHHPDEELPRNERLPRHFKIFIKEHAVNNKTYVLQKWNNVIIGDRLTDNKAEKDDYRFHDVFHFAYAVHLEWSPVLRALFKVKRKSRSDLDENEDGARAILIEEGIATFVFARALERKLFDGLKNLDYDLLKLVHDLVRGFEAERCAPWQWEKAILDGFKVFREITRKENRGGWVIADLDKHTFDFEPGEDTDGP